MPEDAPLYDHMRVNEHLRFMAHLKGLFGRSATLAIGTVAERLQLQTMAEVPIAKLSRGYRQRVAIGQALLNDPKLLIFDEPTSGLDPSQVIAIRDLIRELAGKRTVLMASHVLPEIEQIASRVMILLNGKLLTTDALALAVDGQRLRLQVAGPEPKVREAVGAVPGVRSIVVEPESGGPDLRYYLVEADQRPEVAQEFAAALVGRGLALSELTTVRARSRAHFSATDPATERGSRVRQFLALLVKEEKALFTSPIAYVLIAVFLLIMGYSFTLALFISHTMTLVHHVLPDLHAVPADGADHHHAAHRGGTEVADDGGPAHLAGNRNADRVRKIRGKHEPHPTDADIVRRLSNRARDLWRP